MVPVSEYPDSGVLMANSSFSPVLEVSFGERRGDSVTGLMMCLAVSDSVSRIGLATWQ